MRVALGSYNPLDFAERTSYLRGVDRGLMDPVVGQCTCGTGDGE